MKLMREPHRQVKTTIVVCSRCQTEGLHWVQMANKQWRLFDHNDMIHKCRLGVKR